MLPLVFNDDDEPTSLPRVTLTHIYGSLNRSLSEWEYWNEFVDGLDQRLFEITQLNQSDLRFDASNLSKFLKRIDHEVRRLRLQGRELFVDDENHNRERLAREQRRKELAPAVAETKRKLAYYFPFLNKNS